MVNLVEPHGAFSHCKEDQLSKNRIDALIETIYIDSFSQPDIYKALLKLLNV